MRYEKQDNNIYRLMAETQVENNLLNELYNSVCEMKKSGTVEAKIKVVGRMGGLEYISHLDIIIENLDKNSEKK